MYDFCILTPTFNRSDALKLVITQLQEEAAEHGFSIVHCIVDDGSDWRFHPYKAMVRKMATSKYHFVKERNFKNFGRKWFWKTWNELLKMAKGREWRYAIAMPDDHVPCTNFLVRVRNSFEALYQERDKAAVAMNILVQSERNWQRNRFVDGAFICTRMFFDCLNWRLNPVHDSWFDSCDRNLVPYKRRSPASSGVGKQMTDRLAVHQKCRIAKVRNVSFLTPMRTKSVMFPPDEFPKRPKAWGLSHHNFIDNGNKAPSFLKKGGVMRFGLIGDGRIAGRHKEAIKRIGGEVIKVHDPAMLKLKKDKLPKNACLSLDAAFFDPVDWVVVASPTSCHHAHVKAALKHDKMVICEKPYCLPWQPVIDNDNVFVVMQMRWADLPSTAKRIRIVAARNEAYFQSWKGDPLLTGGLFFDVFIHYVDLARKYGCKLELSVVDEGKQERWIDDFCLMDVDMDAAYESMYRDMVLRRSGIRPKHVAQLHWLLARYTERFGFGREIIGRVLEVSPDGLV